MMHRRRPGAPVLALVMLMAGGMGCEEPDQGLKGPPRQDFWGGAGAQPPPVDRPQNGPPAGAEPGEGDAPPPGEAPPPAADAPAASAADAPAAPAADGAPPPEANADAPGPPPGDEGEEAAAGGPLAPGWEEITEGDLTAEQAALLKKGRAARKGVATELMGALAEQLAEGGPAQAIPFCKSEAVGRTQAGWQEGIRLGRTSHKLRNGANTPERWVLPLVKAMVETPTMVRNADGVVGELVPIKTGAMCLTCHGDPASLAPEVKAALKKDYPEDEATGFAEGDIRGWFWLEIGGEPLPDDGPPPPELPPGVPDDAPQGG